MSKNIVIKPKRLLGVIFFLLIIVFFLMYLFEHPVILSLKDNVSSIFLSYKYSKNCENLKLVDGILFCTYSDVEGTRMVLPNESKLLEWVSLSGIRVNNHHMKIVRLIFSPDVQYRYQLYDPNNDEIIQSYDATFLNDTLAITLNVSNDVLNDLDASQIGAKLSAMTFIGIYQTNNPTYSTEEIYELYAETISQYYDLTAQQLPLSIEK